MDEQNLDPYKISYRLVSKLCGFFTHSWEMDGQMRKICPSISQKCVGPHNIVPKWLDFDGFRQFLALEPLWAVYSKILIHNLDENA